MGQRHAVVAGAGIGGLTAAVALHRRGWRVTVCERADGPTAAGAGIVLAPNALRALEAAGLDVTRSLGDAVPAAAGLRSPDGRWLSRTDTAALTARYGRPALAVHRAGLGDALTAALPPGTVRYRAAVTGTEDQGRTARVHTTAGELVADLVVAADGIRSALRARHFPGHSGLRYSGETAWRTVLPADGLPDLAASETWGPACRFGMVPLADGRVYVYATAAAPEGHRPDDPRGVLLRRHGDWHAPVPELLRRLDPATLLQHDLYDLAGPLPRLHDGRTAWLGDAAHAMTPNLGQGGCQAVEDAAVLAHLVGHGTDPADLPAALAAYTAARLARTDAIRVRARRAGRVAALRNPLAVAARNLALRALPARLAHRATDGLFAGFRLPPRPAV
ncbi:FAD-dependent monooxygenase [Streptomyces bambusae]|uniref:FAD-dependent monooxygenase n=1 Tax=Streptomyces bambusae TaxID=1550616 RepID=UPI001CFD2197|nr:FAD-dependent monooxygenase [Streptomyces bambusae]MCB5165454.1 FAD-dependent monooxygenase [Streptomyces bambusae]